MKLLYIHTFIVIFAALKDIFKQKGIIMKTLAYLGAFVCGALASAVDDFCKKHDIKLNRRDAEDFVENIKDAVDNEMA